MRGAVESPVESRQRVCLCVYETVSAWRACERMGYMAANTQLAGMKNSAKATDQLQPGTEEEGGIGMGQQTDWQRHIFSNVHAMCACMNV